MMLMDNSWGESVIKKALQYANHTWTACEQNLLHGVDPDGRRVDTPDVTWQGEYLDCGWWRIGEVNTGIPYGWGRASTIEEFDAGIKEGKLAGNVPEDKKQPVSYHAVGVDCSGLLTICWELPDKIATRDIPKYADVVDSLPDIRQGDIFAKIGSHTMFFIEFASADMTEALIVDATRSTGKVSVRKIDVAELLKNGYRIYRKK